LQKKRFERRKRKSAGGEEMKNVVVNGSPRAKGNTEMLAEAFLRGAWEAGHEGSLINLREKKIAGCLGCQYCFSHDGVCAQKDGMEEILAELDQADMLVLASPIYWFDVTAQTKAVIDRLYARGKRGFHFHKTALLLNSGSDGVYEAVLTMYRNICGYLNWQDQGIITAPNMSYKGAMQDAPALKAAYELGKGL